MNNVKFMAAALFGAGALAAATFGVVHAASTNQNVGTSGIPRSTFQTVRLDAAASVLHTSTTAVKDARSNKTLKNLIEQSGLTPATFRQQVKADMTTELEKDGYSQDQITIAFQHRTIVRLRLDEKWEGSNSSTGTTTQSIQTT